MAAQPNAERPRVLALASSLAEGAPVDWNDEQARADAEASSVIDELRHLAALARLSDPLPDRWGRYTIQGELGSGSYGTVYRSFDPQLNVDIALKVIRPSTTGDEPDRERALAEARLLAQVNHFNVVRVFAAETLGDEVGVAMELVEGRTLLDIVREQGPLNASEALLIGIDLCKALAAVHTMRLLHGDIKANNVMRAAGGRTVLMDFGAGDDLKQAGIRARNGAGTPIYLAPEVFAGACRSVRSDIYSLGVLLYYLATAKYPVEGSTRTEMGQLHAAGTARHRLREVRPDLPAAFVQVVERATAAAPHDRYASAGDFESALQAALKKEEAPVRRRTAPWLAWAASVALTATAGGAWFAWPVTDVPGSGQTLASLGPGLSAPTPRSDDPTPAVAAADSYSVQAAFYRRQDGQDVPLQGGTRVAEGDELSLRLQASRPVFAYVVTEDDRGESYLLFPLPGQPLANPLPGGTSHVIPGRLHDQDVRWVVSSAGGREHFLVFVSPERPSPAFERMFANLPAPTFGGPPAAQRLSAELVGALRGVGGLIGSPSTQTGPRLAREFAVPLPDGEETASGVWVRQLTLENPGR